MTNRKGFETWETNGTNIAVEPALEAEYLAFGSTTVALRLRSTKYRPGRRARENRGPDTGYPRSAAEAEPAETAADFTLAPLVGAFGIARVLAEAVKELDSHISSETRKVGDTVGRQLNTLQTSVQELYGFLKEQRSTNLAVQEQLQRLTASGAETDARQARELDAVRALVRESSESGKQRIDLLTALRRRNPTPAVVGTGSSAHADDGIFKLCFGTDRQPPRGCRRPAGRYCRRQNRTSGCSSPWM